MGHGCGRTEKEEKFGKCDTSESHVGRGSKLTSSLVGKKLKGRTCCDNGGGGEDVDGGRDIGFRSTSKRASFASPAGRTTRTN